MDNDLPLEFMHEVEGRLRRIIGRLMEGALAGDDETVMYWIGKLDDLTGEVTVILERQGSKSRYGEVG